MSRIRTNIITNRMANGAPTVSNGLVISGITTTSEVNVGAGVTLNVYGGATYSGIITCPNVSVASSVTATTYYGSGANLTGIDATKIITGNTQVQTIDTGSDGHVKVTTEGNERLRIDSTGRMTQNGTTSADTASALTLKNGVSSNDHTILELISDPNQYSMIYLGASDDRYKGQIRYKDNDHFMQIYTNGSEKLRITSDGKMGLGITSPTGQFAVSDGTRIAEINPHSSGTFIGNRSNHPILFQVNASEKVRIDTDGKLTMASGTVELQSHMVRVGNRTTAQINAGVSTATGALTLDTTENNLKYYANAKWRTVKQQANDGSTQTLAARSAKALLDDGITSNGVYWLDMHGAYTSGNAKLHYCLQDTSYDGGGWTMLYSMNHGNNFASGSNYSFSLNVGSPTSVSDFTAGNWGYDRRNTFTPAANDQFLIRRSDNNDWKRFVVTTWSPTANSVSNGWETLNRTDGGNTGHPYWALGQMYDASGNSVSGHTHFNGCAKGGNCNSGGGDGSGFGNYSQWLDCVGNSGFGGGYNSQSNGGSPLYWGQGNALSQGGSLYIQMFYRKAGTQ